MISKKVPYQTQISSTINTATQPATATQPVIFNYSDFLNYYNDPNNYSIDTNNIITNYHESLGHKHYKRKSKLLTKKYITINGQKLYVTIIGKNKDKIIFSIPVQDANGIWWDDHYHFGIDINYKSRRNTKSKYPRFPVIYFHKTVQIPNKKSHHFPCYFADNIDLNAIDISDLKCESHKQIKMGDKFSINSLDFAILKELIRRPFFPPYPPGGIGGKRMRRRTKINKNRRIKKSTRKIKK